MNARFVQAATLLVLTLLTTQAVAQSPRIAGRWANDDNGEVITISSDPMGGYRFFQSDVGEGRIVSTNQEDANIRVSARGLSCYYAANITDGGRRMNWRLSKGQGPCVERIFTRAE